MIAIFILIFNADIIIYLDGMMDINEHCIE